MHRFGALCLSLPALAIMLAGCSGSDGASGPAADEGDSAGDAALGLPAREIPWSLTQCRFAAFVLGVPASAVQPYVPAGFRVQSAGEVAIGGQTGLPVPNPANDGNFGIEAFQCDEGTGLNGTLPGMVYASFFIGVEPPQELRRDVANHFVKLDTLIPDADRRELLAAYGLPVHNGTATMSATVMPGEATEFSGSFEADGMGAFSLSGRAGIPLPNCSFTEYTPIPAGLAEWTMACTIVAGGGAAGSVTVPGDSWAAQVVGAGTHQGAGFAGIVDFHTGSLLLPATTASTA